MTPPSSSSTNPPSSPPSITVTDVMERLELNQTAAYQLIGSWRELGLLKKGDKVRDEGRVTGNSKQSYVVVEEAVELFQGILERLQGMTQKG